MNSRDGYALLAILVLTLLNAFFTLAEVALVTVRNTRLQHLVAEGADAGGAGGVQDLMRQPTRVVATVQVGITLAAFGVAATAAATLAPDCAPWLRRHHVPHEVRAATVLLTLFFALWTIALGEIVPRSLALRDPERFAPARAAAPAPVHGRLRAAGRHRAGPVQPGRAPLRPVGHVRRAPHHRGGAADAAGGGDAVRGHRGGRKARSSAT